MPVSYPSGSSCFAEGSGNYAALSPIPSSWLPRRADDASPRFKSWTKNSKLLADPDESGRINGSGTRLTVPRWALSERFYGWIAVSPGG